MSFDLTTLSAKDTYRLLSSIVVPRPIAWISTLDRCGNRNLAPHSYFSLVSSRPPILQFASTGPKDTLRNVIDTGQFVVNLVSDELGPAMVRTAINIAPTDDEFSYASLEAESSETVAPPRVAGCPAALECQLHMSLPMGDAIVVFGHVLHVHVAAEGWRDGRVDPVRLRLVGRLGGSSYSTIENAYTLQSQW